MHSDEFESVLLSLISIEDLEFFKSVGNYLSEFQTELKKLDNQTKTKRLEEGTLMNVDEYCKLSTFTSLMVLYKMVKFDS